MKPSVALVRFDGDLPSEPYIRYQAGQMREYRCQPVTVGKGINRWAALLTPFFSRWPLPTFDADLVHSHFGPDGAYGAAIARQKGVPHVLSLHGYDVCYPWYRYIRMWRPRFVAYGFNRRKVLRAADLVLCCSEYLKMRAVRLGADAGKTRVHYLGVDLERVNRVLDEMSEPRIGSHHVVCVGRLVPIKGQGTLIKAIPRIRRSIPRLRVTVIGAGPEKERLSRMAGRLGVTDAIEFAGSRSHDDCLRAMATASVVVVPSRRIGDVEEAFGLVAAEAMALGVPVVATRTGGLSELMDDGSLGRLVPEGDHQALAEAVIASMLTPNSDEIRRAQSHVRLRYDAAVQVRCLEKIFDEVVRSHSQTRA